jgi:hypothetical protein
MTRHRLPRPTKSKITIALPTRFVKICELSWLLMANVFGIFLDLYRGAAKFLGPVGDSVQGQINTQEFFRVLALASSGGATAWGACQAINDNIGTIIIDKNLAVFIKAVVSGLQYNHFVVAIAISVFCLDCMRRVNHGPKTPVEGQPQ